MSSCYDCCGFPSDSIHWRIKLKLGSYWAKSDCKFEKNKFFRNKLFFLVQQQTTVKRISKQNGNKFNDAGRARPIDGFAAPTGWWTGVKKRTRNKKLINYFHTKKGGDCEWNAKLKINAKNACAICNTEARVFFQHQILFFAYPRHQFSNRAFHAGSIYTGAYHSDLITFDEKWKEKIFQLVFVHVSTKKKLDIFLLINQCLLLLLSSDDVFDHWKNSIKILIKTKSW